MRSKDLDISMFIDWDRYKNRFYNNLYLEDYKIVVKMPLIHQSEEERKIKIRKFDLTKYTYLVSYE